MLWGAATLLMVVVMLVDRTVSAIPTTVGGLALVASLFTENWSFDAERKEMRRTIGVPPFVRTVTIPANRIDRVQVTTRRRGRSRTGSLTASRGRATD
jgi:hypothetical protein